MDANPELTVGIDLGTTNSVACIFMNNNLKVLENKEGGRTTPSFVFYTDQGIVVGTFACSMAAVKPERGVYEVKRLIGRDFEDPKVKRNIEQYPFEIIEVKNKPMVKVAGRIESPVGLSCHILKKIKRDVEAKLNLTVDKAVITVPAYFNVNQRGATLEAATKAGFTVLKLLNEPTAAALNYYFQKNHDRDHLSLVYDLGGGTFDVAILRKTSTEIKIVAVNGDSHLGGADFDKRIIDYVCEQNSKLDRKDRRLIRRLKNKCEEAKKFLSECEETDIILEDGSDVIDAKLTRKQFEEMCADLFERTMQIVNSCLKAANLTSVDIENVILVGGSTRIPKIQQLVSSYFNGQKVDKSVNPDECVAEGAALQAAKLSSAISQKIGNLSITDVVPLSLGIDCIEGMIFMIKRNSPLPASCTQSLATLADKQSDMLIGVFEGERSDPSKNRLIRSFIVENLTPAPPGDCEVTVNMELNDNGMLTVTATENVSGKKKNLTLSLTKGRLSDQEVDSIVANATEHKEEDEMFEKIAKIKLFVLTYCAGVMYNIDKLGLKEKYFHLYQTCEKILDEVDALPMDDKEPFLQNKEYVVALCDSVVKEKCFQKIPAYSESDE